MARPVDCRSSWPKLRNSMTGRFHPRSSCKFLVLILLFVSPHAWAAPVTVEQARKVVQGWLTLDAAPLHTLLGSQVSRVEPFADTQDRTLYYVVHLVPTGLVIVPADDRVEPIIAFLSGDTYDPSLKNPLGSLVSQDVAGRIGAAQEANARQLAVQTPFSKAQAKWSRLQNLANHGSMTLSGQSSVSDVRVGPLLQTQWNQSTVGNIIGAPACFNYYTPPGPAGSVNNYICGCTATAMAQIMRFWQFPTTGIGVHPFNITVDGVTQSASTRGGDGAGGPYNWSLMVAVPDGSTTLQQRQAIGALCYDAGVAVGMEYAASESSGDVHAAKVALTTTFGYSNTIHWSMFQGHPAMSIDTSVNCNLNAGLPVFLGIYSNSYGHAVVADGYGYNSSTVYHHLNMGWSGVDDAWYNLPDVATSNGTYTLIEECLYNIYSTGKGEIIAGRVTDSTGQPLGGVTVTAVRSGGGTYTATTRSSGVYAIWPVPSASTYTVAASAAGYTSADQTAATGTSADFADTPGNCWGIDFTAFAGKPAALSVTPASGFTSTGSAGGPFSPTTAVYTLSNTGEEAMNWTAAKTQSWVTLSESSGTLAPGATAAVTVSLNAAANNLAADSYGDTVTFTNATNAIGSTTRAVALTVTPTLPDFVVTSISLDPSSPTQDGTFTATVTVQNQGKGSGNAWYLAVWANKSDVAYPADLSDDYLAVGDLAPGQSKTFTFSGLSAGSAGAKTFRASVDDTWGTDESNEDNNQATLAYSVTEPAVSPTPTGSGGCGQSVGAGNILGFYALGWAGLAGIKRGLRRVPWSRCL